MSEVQQPSDEDLRIKREEFDDSRRELSAELERVMWELSNATRPSERVPNTFLQRIITDLKDTKSSKFEIQQCLNDEMSNPQEAEGLKQEVTEQKITKFSSTLSQLYRLYYAAITHQARRVRSLCKVRTSRSELEEAEERLKALKAEYLSDTGEEWSDVREEGPIILTRNAVRGEEMSSELTDIVKQLKSDGVMRSVLSCHYKI